MKPSSLLREMDNYPQQCSDSSHLVFQLNSTCNSTKLREKYEQTFCTGDSKVLPGKYCEGALHHKFSDIECRKEFLN